MGLRVVGIGEGTGEGEGRDVGEVVGFDDDDDDFQLIGLPVGE